MVKLLELYAGSRSIGKAAESLGMQVFSVDINAFDGINLVKDIEEMSIADIPFIPDVVWASPPCTTYSIAAISHHRNGVLPKTDFAAKSDRLIVHTLDIIQRFDNEKSVLGGIKWFMENPVGMLRKMPFMKGLQRTTVSYCRYGDTRMKPTDIWTNHLRGIFTPNGWQPRPMCYNGNVNCQHEPAPRGSRTGTQGRTGAYNRSKIPHKLCIEILKSCL